ncbi:MAG: flagellar motor protein [Candidatus Gastranaerophilales bacterium]|nr:flagellar motor protein [Candidatus Gastranaerophilales bacterium]
MDIASLIGLFIGFFAIIGALCLESGSILSIFQLSSAFIVIGGTCGAIFLNFPLENIINAFKSVKKVFYNEKENFQEVLDQIIIIANVARQGGMLALQEIVPSIDHEFLRRGTQLTIDITNPELLQEILIKEISLDEEEGLLNARIFEAMGGFAPTFGIIGAVLGLIQVMSNLKDPTHLGQGIALSFVATFYGVGLANMLFLPIAGKLKLRLREEIILKEMIVQGLISIHFGENPTLIEEKLITFINFSNRQNQFLTEYKVNERTA